MGFSGWSKGCDRCRKSHTRCDQAKPACVRCTRRGLPCPGYRSQDGVIFKNETTAVVSRYGRHCEQTSLPATPNVDIQASAVHYFFLNCVFSPTRNTGLSRGMFDHMAPLYLKALPTSPLALAVGMMARQSLQLCLGMAPDSAYHKAELDVCKALQQAIADPAEQKKDETLLAVLVLNFVTDIQCSAPGMPGSESHLDGAVALIQLRGQDNDRDDVSASLLAAARSAVLKQALWSYDQHHAQAVRKLPRQTRSYNVVADLLDILSEVFMMEISVCHEYKTLSGTALRHAFDMRTVRAQELLLRLAAWYDNLPQTWKVLAASIEALPGRATCPVVNVEIAHTLGEWHCLRIWLLKILYVTAADSEQAEYASKHARSALQALCRIIAITQAGAQQAVPPETGLQEGSLRMPANLKRGICQEQNGINLVQWAFAILTEDLEGTDGFDIGRESMLLLQAQAEVAKASPFKYLDHWDIYY